MEREFTKMHGLGNDFAVFDCREGGNPFAAETVRRLADRRYGVGCDQLLVLEKAHDGKADFFMRIYNPDGSQAQACGNGTRCVAHKFMRDSGRKECVIQTVAGLLGCAMVDNDMVRVDMGAPRLKWDQIPLAQECDTLNLGIIDGPLHNPVAVNVGNPHTVFFVEDLGKIKIEELGPQVERHVMFPERTNVEFVQVNSPELLRVRVWERGTGVTQACGSGACATIVAAVRRGLSSRKAEIVLDGGSLYLEWRAEDEHVLMTGPVSYVFEGRISFSG